MYVHTYIHFNIVRTKANGKNWKEIGQNALNLIIYICMCMYVCACAGSGNQMNSLDWLEIDEKWTLNSQMLNVKATIGEYKMCFVAKGVLNAHRCDGRAVDRI